MKQAVVEALIGRLIDEAIGTCEPENADEKATAHTRSVLRRKFTDALSRLQPGKGEEGRASARREGAEAAAKLVDRLTVAVIKLEEPRRHDNPIGVGILQDVSKLTATLASDIRNLYPASEASGPSPPRTGGENG